MSVASFALLVFAQLFVLCTLPILVVGAINRTKAVWAGRRGPPLLQLGYDLVRLARKRAVVSEVATFVFRGAPYVVLATSLVSGAIAPVLGVRAPLAFDFDFVWFAYVWGLGRVALMLGALDTGSAFEGMGASREATFAAVLEPAFFLVAGAACLATHERSFSALLALRATGTSAFVWAGSIVALLVVVQVESARMPVDDPTTHLELTMIHEVMILDHSGPDLAAMQAASAVKLTVGLSLIATLINPLIGRAHGVIVALANVLICVGLAIGIGTVESLIARLKMRAVPQYVLVAIVAGGAALLATTFLGAHGGAG